MVMDSFIRKELLNYFNAMYDSPPMSPSELKSCIEILHQGGNQRLSELTESLLEQRENVLLDRKPSIEVESGYVDHNIELSEYLISGVPDKEMGALKEVPEGLTDALHHFDLENYDKAIEIGNKMLERTRKAKDVAPFAADHGFMANRFISKANDMHDTPLGEKLAAHAREHMKYSR